jgi:multidrug efflux pump subunit AcrB
MFIKPSLNGLARLWLLFLGGGAMLLDCGPNSAAAAPPPTAIVETKYPGANAQVVAEAVAAPIEQQIKGIEKLRSLRSQCRSDGSYLLAVVFAEGVDRSLAQTLVQKRVSLALPTLPDAVRTRGASVKQGSPGLLMICSLSSPDGRYDRLFLSKYAALQLHDEIARIPGVGDISVFGDCNYRLRLLLDTAKMTALNLSVGDVATAVKQQNAPAAPGQAGLPATQQQPAITNAADEFGGIIVKADAVANIIRLRDVATIEQGVGEPRSDASLDGKTVVALAICQLDQANPREASDAIKKKLSELRERLPKGLALDVAFDFTKDLETPKQPDSSRYVLIDLALPAATSSDRVSRFLRRCDSLLHQIEGVQNVLALSENPFDRFRNGPCVLVRLPSANGKTKSLADFKQAVRAQLAQVADAVMGLRDLSEASSFPRCAYPLDMAISGPDEHQVDALAAKLVERLRDPKILTDLWASRESKLDLRMVVDIDRAKASKLGVELTDIADTVQASVGSLNADEFKQFGDASPIIIETVVRLDGKLKSIERLKLRSAKGEMVPLTADAQVHEVARPANVDRLDLQPMVEITANPASGGAIAAVRARCESVTEEIRNELGLSAEYRLHWLQAMPAGR